LIFLYLILGGGGGIVPHGHGPELIGGHAPVVVEPVHGPIGGGGLSASGANAGASTQTLTAG
jgi:hypothetical protein